MKAKKEFSILILVIVALCLYLAFRTQDKTHYQLPNISPPSEAEITKIEITRPGSVLLLKRDGKDTWLIEPDGFLADPDKIKGILDVIGGLSATELVSESKNYVRYDLNKDNKINVKAWASDSLKLDFDIGKTAPSQHHTFFKIPDDFRVYYAKGSFRNLFDQKMDELRDKTVLRFDQKEIQEIEIAKGNETIMVARKQVPLEAEKRDGGTKDAPPHNDETSVSTETSWETPDGKKADGPVLDTLLSTLSHLECKDYLEAGKKKDLSEPVFIIKLKGSRDYTLTVFKKPDDNTTEYPAVSSENDYPFQLSEYKAEEIMKGPKDLLKNADPPSVK